MVATLPRILFRVSAVAFAAAFALPIAAQHPSVPPPVPCLANRSAESPVRGRAREGTVAVITFLDATGEAGTGFVADALADEIAARLNGIRPAKTVSRFALRRPPPGTRDEVVLLGQVLRVRFLVTGLVTPEHEGMNVAIQLWDAEKGTAIWNASYARPLAALVSLQEEIVREVAKRVHGDASLATLRRGFTPGTSSIPAYTAYLRGNYYFRQRTRGAIARAIASYQEATQLDSTFAHAYARSALSFATVLEQGWDYAGLAPSALLDAGWTAAERAVRLDAKAADGWLARAVLLQFRNPRTFEGVSAAYERAIALDPGNAEAFRLYARSLVNLGAYAPAEAMLRRSNSIEPQQAPALVDLAELRLSRRDFRVACGLLNDAIRRDPRYAHAYALRALARVHHGEVRSAWGDAETASRLGDVVWGDAIAAMVDMQARDTVAASRRVKQLVRQETAGSARLTPTSAKYLVLALAALGDSTRALDVLERVEPRGVTLWTLLQDRRLASLRSSARYRKLIEQSRRTAASN